MQNLELQFQMDFSKPTFVASRQEYLAGLLNAAFSSHYTGNACKGQPDLTGLCGLRCPPITLLHSSGIIVQLVRPSFGRLKLEHCLAFHTYHHSNICRIETHKNINLYLGIVRQRTVKVTRQDQTSFDKFRQVLYGQHAQLYQPFYQPQSSKY